MEQRRHSYEEVVLNYLRQLLAAVPQKQDGARAISLQTLLDYQANLKTSDSAQFKNLLATMPEVFGRLPLDAQIRLLTYQWKPMANLACFRSCGEHTNDTLFIWGQRGGGVDESKAQQIFLQLKGYLEEHGMKLEPESTQ